MTLGRALKALAGVAILFTLAFYWTDLTGLPQVVLDVIWVIWMAALLASALWSAAPAHVLVSLGLVALGAAVVIGGLVLAHQGVLNLSLTPFLPFAACNVAVAVVFARGLSKSRRMLILQLVDSMKLGPAPSEAFEAFARRQSYAWVAMGSLSALVAFAGMLFSEARDFAGAAISVLAFLQIGWFIVSHMIATRHYERPEGWLDTLGAMVTPKNWSTLEI